MHRSALLLFSACLLSGTAQAADMIIDDGYSQKTHRSVAVTHTAPRYVAYAYEVCDDLILTYRPPHDPRREIVRVCHPPLPGQ